MKRPKHFLSIADLSRKDIEFLIKNSIKIKKNPRKYSDSMEDKTLLMLFEAPSLRTRISFETGMTQMDGHAIYYDMKESTIGKKETIKDLANVVSRYCDLIMARIASHEDIRELAANSRVPVINGLTSYEHPCQIIADVLTIYEIKKKFKVNLAYLGDGNNNTTHSLLFAASILGMNIAVASPKGKDYEPQSNVIKRAKQFARKSGSKVLVADNPKLAVKDADFVYTDSWMSYHIPPGEEDRRIKIFSPYQVNSSIMKMAKKDAKFMHCLPAKRRQEVTADVIDGKQSIVYQQAENRLHAQKAIMLWLMNRL